MTFSNVLGLGVMYYSPIKEDPSGKKTHQVWWGSKHLFLLFIFASRSLDIFSKAAFPLKIFHTTKVGDFSQSLKRNIYIDMITLLPIMNHFHEIILAFCNLLRTLTKFKKGLMKKKELLYSRVWNKYNPFIVWTKYCAGTVLKTNGLYVSYSFQVAPFLLKGYGWFVKAITKYEWPRKRPHFCRASLFRRPNKSFSLQHTLQRWPRIVAASLS